MFQARMALLILFLGCAWSLAAFSDDAKKNDDLPDFLKPLVEAEKVTLYSIDPTPKRSEKTPPPKPAEEFQDYPVLGKLEIKDAKIRQELVQELLKGTQNNKHGFARCFWPRHALRAEKGGKVTEYLICFHCHWVKVFTGKDVQDIVTNNQPQVFLNRLLEKAKIPVAP